MDRQMLNQFLLQVSKEDYQPFSDWLSANAHTVLTLDREMVAEVLGVQNSYHLGRAIQFSIISEVDLSESGLTASEIAAFFQGLGEKSLKKMTLSDIFMTGHADDVSLMLSALRDAKIEHLDARRNPLNKKEVFSLMNGLRDSYVKKLEIALDDSIPFRLNNDHLAFVIKLCGAAFLMSTISLSIRLIATNLHMIERGFYIEMPLVAMMFGAPAMLYFHEELAELAKFALVESPDSIANSLIGTSLVDCTISNLRGEENRMMQDLLQRALEINRELINQKAVMPYVVSRVANALNEHPTLTLFRPPLTEDSTVEEEIKYGIEIFSLLDEDLQAKVLRAYNPRMSTNSAVTYSYRHLERAGEHHKSNPLLIENIDSDRIVSYEDVDDIRGRPYCSIM